jgi:predicted acyl esterase
MEMIGPAAIKFFVAIDQDDTNWIAHLFDMAPTGLETRIARGYLKASHRGRSTLINRNPMPPITPTQAQSLLSPVKSMNIISASAMS